MRGHPDSSGQKESSSSNDIVAPKEVEDNPSNVDEENNDRYEAGSSVDSKGEGNHDEKREEADAAGDEDDKEDANEEDDDQNVQSKLESLWEELIQLPVVDLEKGCSMISHLVDKLTHIFALGLSDSFYPVPQDAIGVGSTSNPVVIVQNTKISINL